MSDDKQVVWAKTTNTAGRPCLRTEPRSSPLKLLAVPLSWSTWELETTGPLATVRPSSRPRSALSSPGPHWGSCSLGIPWFRWWWQQPGAAPADTLTLGAGSGIPALIKILDLGLPWWRSG